MAIYQKLSLSAGGGIISTAQQAAQSGTANILIGLGGTGISCLRSIKRAVYERLQPDDLKVDPPEYKHIKFWAIDSDTNDLGRPEEVDSIPETEFFKISSNDIESAIRNELVMAAKPELSWMRNQEIDVPALAAGAGGKRQIGRYLIMDRSFSFISELVSKINSAKAGLGATSVGVHIFAGLSGGTGSGTFLDICYMAQKAMSLAGATGNDKIYGYFFLPDVNLCKVTDPATRAYIPRNGYAALKELDYCMQLEKNGGAFEQLYGNGTKISWHRPPVDLCHLVSATNTVGAVQQNGYEYAMNVVTDYVMEFLAKSNGFTISSHLSNVSAKVATVQKTHGACNQYFVIGAANAQVPLKEINTFLASALFHRFAVLNGRQPSGKELNDFATEVGLIYENMYRVVKSAAGGDFSPSGVTHQEVRENGNRAIEQHYERERDNMMGGIETKVKALSDPRVADSYINRICAALNARICQPQFGPYFASQILNAAQEQNLLNIVDGLIKNNSERLNYENMQSQRLWDEYHSTNNAQKSKANKKTVAAYENALLNLDMHEIEMDVFQQIGKLLVTLKEQIVAASTTFYSVFARVITNLSQTFEGNYNVLNAAAPVAAVANPYVMPLVTMNQIRPTLEKYVEGMNLDGMIQSFMGYLLQNSAAWRDGDETKISRVVTDYFVKQAFSDFANRNIMNYLQDIYGTSNVPQLTEHIYNDYMQPLMDKAEPLFWNNNAYFSTASAGKMGYVSVPNTAPAIVGAATNLVNNASTAGLQSRQTALSDRIYIMRSFCGLPMFAYHALLNYESEYWKAQEIGRHYYEGKPQPPEGNPVWDWRTLPSVIPQSLCSNAMPDEVKRDVGEGRQLFQIAVQRGFIRPETPGSNTMLLYRPSDAYLQQLQAMIEKGEQLYAVRDAMNGGMLKLQLEKLIAAPDVTPTNYRIQCDAVGVADARVRQNIVCDYFVSSPIFRATVKQAVSMLLSANDLLERLTELGEMGNVQQNYFDALFAGMFVVSGPKVSYTINNMGMKEEIPLSLPTMPYGMMPLYQAYLNYTQLKPDMLSAIKEESDRRKNNAAPQMIAALKAFKAGLNQNYMQFMQSNARKHPAEYDKIIQFFVDLMTTLQTTAPLYGL